MAVWLTWALLIVVGAYFLGSTPTGYLAGRWLKGIDIRQHGSGSTGATNVLRTLGKGPGFTVLGIDVIKGALAIALTRWLYSLPSVAQTAPATTNIEAWVPWATVLAGLAVLIGHSRSIWLGFTGGKSVASSLGVLFALHWPTALIAIGAFILTVSIARIVSLGSIVGAIAVPVAVIIAQEPLPIVLFGVAAALYILTTHRSNIQRILSGKEPRLGKKNKEERPSESPPPKATTH